MGPNYQQDPDGLARFGLRAEVNLPIINTGRPLETQRMTELNQRTPDWRNRMQLEAANTVSAEWIETSAFSNMKLSMPSTATRQRDDTK